MITSSFVRLFYSLHSDDFRITIKSVGRPILNAMAWHPMRALYFHCSFQRSPTLDDFDEEDNDKGSFFYRENFSKRNQ